MKLHLGMAGLATVVAVLLTPVTPAPAAAHVCMDFPVSRVGPECVARSPQKIGACPIEGRTEFINVFRPGETIRVRIRETINHPSHYRIAFNPDGDAFEDPQAIDDIDGERLHVLIDGIEDAEAAEQEVEITFPRVECENCTLQLIQVMYDKQGNGFGGANGGPDDNDDLYYSCADIVLRGEPVAASADDATDRRLAGVPVWIGVLALVGISAGGVRRMVGRRSSES